MTHNAHVPSDKQENKYLIKPGKDEMNLSEFPLVKLGKRDKRKILIYERIVKQKDGKTHLQKWEVHGSAGIGLPDETGDRVIVALLALTAEQGFSSPKVEFSLYRILKMLALTDSKPNYEALENVLKQLVAITIYSEQAFYDKQEKKRITTHKAFHVIEDLWLRKWEDDEDVKSSETSQAYMVWSETFWKSLKSGYIKNLDLNFYYSLDNATTRRLYRFLDKWMHYRTRCEIDIFDLAARLGMVRYRYPSEAKKALKSAFEELIARHYLDSAEVYKKGKYTRVRFVKARAPTLWEEVVTAPVQDAENDSERNGSGDSGLATNEWTTIYEKYGTTETDRTIWSNILEEFERSLPHASFHTFMADTVLLTINNTEAVIGTVSVDGHEWLERQMARKIRMALEDHLDTPIKSLTFVSLRDESAEPGTVGS